MAHIKYSPIWSNSRQAQPSLTNEFSAFIIHIKQTAPKISEPMLFDSVKLKVVPLPASFHPTETNSIEVKLWDSLTQSMEPYSWALGFCLWGMPGERLIICDPQSFYLGGAVLFWKTFTEFPLSVGVNLSSMLVRLPLHSIQPHFLSSLLFQG